MKSLTAAFLLVAPFGALAQTTVSASAAPSDSPKVTVTSRGNDVRLILTNMFSQAKKSFVLQPNIDFCLYLSLQDTEFQKALDVICGQADLKYDLRDGIYHIYKRKQATPAIQAPISESPKSLTLPLPSEASVVEAKKLGRLPLSIFRKKVSTKLSKAPIGAVLEELGAQAGVTIELGDNVPAYRLDAFLSNTTLRYALEQVTRAAKLTYTLTEHHTILVDSRS